MFYLWLCLWPAWCLCFALDKITVRANIARIRIILLIDANSTVWPALKLRSTCLDNYSFSVTWSLDIPCLLWLHRSALARNRAACRWPRNALWVSSAEKFCCSSVPTRRILLWSLIIVNHNSSEFVFPQKLPSLIKEQWIQADDTTMVYKMIN